MRPGEGHPVYSIISPLTPVWILGLVKTYLLGIEPLILSYFSVWEWFDIDCYIYLKDLFVACEIVGYCHMFIVKYIIITRKHQWHLVKLQVF